MSMEMVPCSHFHAWPGILHLHKRFDLASGTRSTPSRAEHHTTALNGSNTIAHMKLGCYEAAKCVDRRVGLCAAAACWLHKQPHRQDFS